MYHLYLSVEAGDVALDSLEAPLAADLAEYGQQLRQAARDTVEDKIQEAARQRLREEGLPAPARDVAVDLPKTEGENQDVVPGRPS
jgi:hypothetical protein